MVYDLTENRWRDDVLANGRVDHVPFLHLIEKLREIGEIQHFEKVAFIRLRVDGVDLVMERK